VCISVRTKVILLLCRCLFFFMCDCVITVPFLVHLERVTKRLEREGHPTLFIYIYVSVRIIFTVGLLFFYVIVITVPFLVLGRVTKRRERERGEHPLKTMCVCVINGIPHHSVKCVSSSEKKTVCAPLFEHTLFFCSCKYLKRTQIFRFFC